MQYMEPVLNMVESLSGDRTSNLSETEAQGAKRMSKGEIRDRVGAERLVTLRHT